MGLFPCVITAPICLDEASVKKSIIVMVKLTCLVLVDYEHDARTTTRQLDDAGYRRKQSMAASAQR